MLSHEETHQGMDARHEDLWGSWRGGRDRGFIALWQFLQGRKRFWLVPIILALLLVTALLILGDGVVVLPSELGSGLVSVEF